MHVITGHELRQQLANFLTQNPDSQIGGVDVAHHIANDALVDNIELDDDVVASYATRMCDGAWGGEIEVSYHFMTYSSFLIITHSYTVALDLSDLRCSNCCVQS